MAVGDRTELGCSPTLFAAAGYLWAYRLKAQASFKLVDSLVPLSTGVVIAAHTLVERDEFTLYSSGALASRRLPDWLGAGLQTPGCPSFSFQVGLCLTLRRASRHLLGCTRVMKSSPSEGGLLCSITVYNQLKLISQFKGLFESRVWRT